MKTEAAKRHERYPCLDGLRALAVTLVFVFHGALGSAWIARHAGDSIVHFNIGVEIFFVLSGFLIYRPFVSANLAHTDAGGLWSYAVRRTLRIFPAYLVALFVLWFLGDIDINGTWGLIKHATLTNIYFRDIGGFGIAPSWTLVVELSFYAFVPLWALFMRAVSRAGSPFGIEIAGALTLIVVGYLSSAWVFFGSPPPAIGVLPAGLGALGAGMLLAVLSAASARDEELGARANKLGRFPTVSWGIALALFVYLMSRSYHYLGSTPSELMWDRALKIPIALLLVLPAVFGDQREGVLRRMLSAAPVAYLGLVSYGIYLWHQNVSEHIATPDALNHHGTFYAIGSLVLAYGATVVVASASFFVVERPVLRLARRPRVAPREPSGSVVERVGERVGPREPSGPVVVRVGERVGLAIALVVLVGAVAFGTMSVTAQADGETLDCGSGLSPTDKDEREIEADARAFAQRVFGQSVPASSAGLSAACDERIGSRRVISSGLIVGSALTIGIILIAMRQRSPVWAPVATTAGGLNSEGEPSRDGLDTRPDAVGNIDGDLDNSRGHPPG